ncbi:hypothetical protein P3W45_001561 [Vairimorpha bombi]|jgi:hypothetical protein
MLVTNLILLCTLCRPNEDFKSHKDVYKKLSESLSLQNDIITSDVHTKILKRFDIKIPKEFRLKLNARLFFHNTQVIFKTILNNLTESIDKFNRIDGVEEYTFEISYIFGDLINKIYSDFFISPDIDLIKESKKLLEVHRKTRIEFSKDNVLDFCLKYFIYSTLVGENVCQPLDKFQTFYDDIDARNPKEVSKKDYRLVYGNTIVDSYTNMNVTLATIMSLIYNSVKKN